MGALVTCNGADVLEAHISLPLHGAWFAELAVETVAPSGFVPIEADGGLAISGTVSGASGVDETARGIVRIVGGRGGLGKYVSSSYRAAQLRDALRAALDAGGEKLAASASDALLSTALGYWTQGRHLVSRELDDLTIAASDIVGNDVHWRFLPDGSLWLGVETWPTVRLRTGEQVEKTFPDERRVVLQVATPWLMPGVALEDVGLVRAVDHWVTPNAVRTWVWL